MAGGKAGGVTPFDNEQAHRIAKLAAEHVHMIEHNRSMRALVEALPATASLRNTSEVRRDYTETVLAAETAWLDLVSAVLEAEGRQS
jgi:hypothetical protein